MKAIGYQTVALLSTCILFGCGQTQSKTPPKANNAKHDSKQFTNTAFHKKPTVQWQFRVEGGAFDTTPLVHNDRVFIGDFDGNFYALDTNNGEQVWKAPGQIRFLAKASLKDGRIFVGDEEGNFRCLDASNGNQLWSNSFGMTTISTGANFYRNRVVIGAQNGLVRCFHCKTGKQLWEFQAVSEVRAPISIVDDFGLVVGACQSMVEVIDLRTGKKQRDFELPGETLTELSEQGDAVLAATMRGHAVRMNWKSGKQDWVTQIEPAPREITGAFSFHNNLAIIGASDRRVRAFNTETGNLEWSQRTKGAISATARIRDGCLFVTTTRGELIAMRPDSGDELWKIELGGDFLGSAAIAENKVVVANGNGVIYAFAAQ